MAVSAPARASGVLVAALGLEAADPSLAGEWRAAASRESRPPDFLDGDAVSAACRTAYLPANDESTPGHTKEN